MSAKSPTTIAAVVLTLVVVVGPTLFWVLARQREPAWEPRAVALVNGIAIFSDDLDVRLEQLLPIASHHGDVEPERLLSLKRAALDDLVFDELIYREAIAAGRRARAEAVETELAAVKARFDAPAQFAAALQENGLTENAVRERLARAALIREARADHERQAITDADLAAYYRENGTKFQHPERVHLLEILFRVDPADPSSAAAAERKARETLARLQRGEAFGPLARSRSEDEYRVMDGDMGMVDRGRLDADLEAAVFAAPLGRLEIAHSLHGVAVFEVLERQPPSQVPFDEARPIIAERLKRQRRDESLRTWRARLVAGARIEIRDAVLRRATAAELPGLTMDPGRRPRPGDVLRSQQ